MGVLLEFGANVNHQDMAGEHCYTSASQIIKSINAAHLILEHGADPNFQDII